MGRPAEHDADSLLDAAVRLFGGGGTTAVTMSAVARDAGAASGSVYHRFPNRAALLAATWLRTTERFGAAVQRQLGEEPEVVRAVDTAAWVVTWCGEHLPDALVLQAGVAAFSPETWSDVDRERLERGNRARRRTLARTTRHLAAITGRPRDEVAFALLDLPLATVRAPLSSGTAPPASAAGLVRRLAARLLLDD